MALPSGSAFGSQRRTWHPTARSASKDRRRRGAAGRASLWLLPLTLALIMPALIPRTARAQAPSLVDVLTRATDYVERLHDQLSGVVAEERYEQRVRAPESRGFGDYALARRVLRSDFLLIRPEGAQRHYGFRDVFEVDGRPVRDRQDRLTTLFLDPSVSAQRQIQGIRAESARYNLGGVERNFNTPTFALLFLRSSHKLRFEFERITDSSPRLGLDPPADDDGVWVLRYTEVWPTTVIRGRDGRNLPAEGRFWIGAATGRVLLTELTVDDDEVEATITVSYGPDDTMGHLVPVEMRERYDNRPQQSRVDGTATYSRFRRFQVQTQESKPFRD